MTRSDLVAALASQFRQLQSQDVQMSVKVVLDGMTHALGRGGRVEIRGFGSFDLNHRPPRIAHNPKTGQRVAVPAKCVPHFKAGKELRERVNR